MLASGQIAVNNGYVLFAVLAVLAIAGTALEKLVSWVVGAFAGGSIDGETPLLSTKEREHALRTAGGIILTLCITVGLLLVAVVGYLTYRGSDLYSILLAELQVGTYDVPISSVVRQGLDIVLVVVVLALINAAGRIVCTRIAEALQKAESVAMEPERLQRLSKRAQCFISAFVWLVGAGSVLLLMQVRGVAQYVILLPFTIALVFSLTVFAIDALGAVIDSIYLRALKHWQATDSPWLKRRDEVERVLQTLRLSLAVGVAVLALVGGVAGPMVTAATGPGEESLTTILPILGQAGRLVLVWVLAIPLLAVLGLAGSNTKPREYHWARIAIWAVAIAVTLKTFGIDIVGILWLLAALLAIAAFAARPVVGDRIAGMALSSGHDLAVGDVVRIGAHEGRVQEIGAQYTKLRGSSGEIHLIPNGDIRELTKSCPTDAGEANAVEDGQDAEHGDQSPQQAPERIDA